MVQPTLQFYLVRNTHLFSNRPGAVEEVASLREEVHLGPDQLLHPLRAADYIVRRGKLRVSQFLPDGREVTRSVLQAGSVFFTRDCEAGATPVDDPGADRYDLTDIVLMALSEGELWILPPDSLKITLQIED